MDAPKSRYRVIERDGKLFVLESATNLAPKSARQIRREAARASTVPSGPPEITIEPEPAQSLEEADDSAGPEPMSVEPGWRHGGEYMPERQNAFLAVLSEESHVPGAAPNKDAMGVISGLVAVLVGALMGGLLGTAMILGGLAYGAWKFWNLKAEDADE